MPVPGESLSHYRLVERIGEGGMGDVWKAVDTKLNREVAIKILPSELASEPKRRERFEAEARAVAALNHPNIVTIHSVEQEDGLHFITMELVRGRSLSDEIPASGLPLKRFFELSLPLVAAVHAAHECGLTHRDLKPANVMVGDDGRVKVLDFGLAQFRDPDVPTDSTELPTKTLTQERTVRGTLPYMSPEQVKEMPLDHRTDIFSLGVTLYEMITGRRPFRGDTSAEIIASVLRDLPPNVSECRSEAPRRLSRIIWECMEKDRDDRTQSAREVFKQLEDLQREEETGDFTDEARGVRVAGESPSRLRSLAVLPLTNLSGDASQEFFADGMTDALITGLAKIASLKVISRTSVMQYKGTQKPIREIARELRVGAVVEGSVIRAGQRVRINAQLIDAKNDEHLWAESYDREIQDVLGLQGEVASAIAGQVQARLTEYERGRLAGGRTVCPEAHDACLRGRHFWYKRTTDDVKKGLVFFLKAIELDPSYAPAWAGVADSYLVDGGRYLDLAPEEAYQKAWEAARKAVELDDDLAEAHTSLAAVMSERDWDWAGSKREFRRAIQLNPNYAQAHYWFADQLSRMGHQDEAIAEAEFAQEIDPLSLISNHMVAWVLYFARRHDEAIEQSRRTLELDDQYLAAYRLLGWALEEKGHFEEAIAAHAVAASLSGDNPSFRGPLGRTYALAGKREEACEILQLLIDQSRTRIVPPLDVAVTHAALGDNDQAFEWLDRAVAAHGDDITYLKVSPRVDALRADPRFDDLVERMQLIDDTQPG